MKRPNPEIQSLYPKPKPYEKDTWGPKDSGGNWTQYVAAKPRKPRSKRA